MLCFLLAWPAPGPRAWDAPGHRTIACLALATVDLSTAPWLGTADMRERILFQSNQPDRLRSRQSPVVRHLNAAEHYFEIDSLDRHGLTLGTVPLLRRAYLRSIILGGERRDAKAVLATPPQYLLAGPGFLAHGAMEALDLLAAALHQVRILEALANPRREAQLQQSRADVIHALGRLSHLVGDGSQPLHTTRHFNGWSGSNPSGYTRNKAFHRQVDSMPGRDDRLSCAALLPRLLAMIHGNPATPSELANPDESWEEILTYLGNTYAQVKPLYTLERDGLLAGPAGTDFVAHRLLAGATILANLLQGALEGSPPSSADIARFVRQTELPTCCFQSTTGRNRLE